MQTHFHLVCDFNECFLMLYISFKLLIIENISLEITINFLYEIKFK